MPTQQQIMYVLGVLTAAAPLLLTLILGLASLLERRLSERNTGRLVQFCVVVGLLASLAMLALMLITGQRHLTIELGSWAAMEDYHFVLKLVFDRLSVPFAILSFLLCGTIGAFANSYLHREPGFHRFFVLYSLFILGMVTASLADTIETLFIGWELVGLSSALLVAFFQERTMPAVNGLRVWSVYRFSDAALLLASVVLHHLHGHGDFDTLLGAEPWPFGETALTSNQALLVGMLIVIAAAGKSALIPFSGWLPRAMEGPTPSSAIFYGALSVHLGAFLLLRFSPVLEASLIVSAVVVTLGLATAALAAMASRVQSDVKSALSFASLTQVGIIVAEIGMGFRYVALVHILGHACLRTLQFLRASSVLQDYRTLEDALGNALPNRGVFWERLLPLSARAWWYRFAFERGYLDAYLNDYVARPFTKLFRGFDALERRWTDLLAGVPSRESDRIPPVGALEETL
jgi:NADH-quinone oxidoreductase subunit L